VICSAGWGGRRPLKVARGRDEFVVGAARINGIKGFFANSRPAKFRGIIRATFQPYLNLRK